MSSAFPFQALNTNGSPRFAAEPGLTKREYMATAIMATLVSREIIEGYGADWSVVAKEAASSADALIAALAARPTSKEPA